MSHLPEDKAPLAREQCHIFQWTMSFLPKEKIIIDSEQCLICLIDMLSRLNGVHFMHKELLLSRKIERSVKMRCSLWEKSYIGYGFQPI